MIGAPDPHPHHLSNSYPQFSDEIYSPSPLPTPHSRRPDTCLCPDLPCENVYPWKRHCKLKCEKFKNKFNDIVFLFLQFSVQLHKEWCMTRCVPVNFVRVVGWVDGCAYICGRASSLSGDSCVSTTFNRKRSSKRGSSWHLLNDNCLALEINMH